MTPKAGRLTRELIVDGCALAYTVRGSGPPVVLIHGVGVCGSTGGGGSQTEALSANYSCLLLDNRGIGASQPAGSAITIPRMAKDVLAVMDAMGWQSIHLAGHSMGGLIALELALTAPRRIRSLSLLCTFARGSDATRLTGRLLWIGLRLGLGPRAVRRRAFLELISRPGTTGQEALDLAERLSQLFGHDVADQPPVVLRQLAALSRHDVTHRLGELAGIPTLVVSAEHDRIAPPSSGRAIAVGIPGSRYVEIPDAAHDVPIVNDARINELLLEHIRRN